MNDLTVSRRYRWTAAVAGAALVAGAAGAVPASGTIGPAGIRAGNNITVFHNLDFVAVVGYGPRLGDRVTVNVIRNGVRIGRASGPAIDAEGAPGLEVNHGPEGAVRPGDCWEGHTPDIQPGDLIRVTDSRGTDEVIVDNIRFTSSPEKDLLSIPTQEDVLVHGVAQRADGTPIPVEQLDSAEFRDGSRLRAEASEVTVEQAGSDGEFTVRYEWPFNFARNRDGLSPQQIQQRLLAVEDGHAIGFGHVDPLPLESMLVEGIADVPGPAPGCEAAPTADDGVASVSPQVVNATTAPDKAVRVSGFSTDAGEVVVTLTDRGGTVVESDATLSDPSGSQTWRARFGAEQLADLEGTVQVTALVDGVASGISKTMLKDTDAPNAPTARPGGGTFARPKLVALRAAAGDRIRYTLGDGSQASPTARSGRRYTGTRIRIARTKTLKAIAIDRAGNVSRVLRQRYRIR